MHHVAIMKKSWKLIPKIISGEKTIESRWYQTKRTPWNRIKSGDTIFFKNSGESIIIQATASHVLQFTIRNKKEAKEIIKKYGERICLPNRNLETWDNIPKYCVLIFLKNKKEIKSPFYFDKSGFGIGAAWITIKNIKMVSKRKVLDRVSQLILKHLSLSTGVLVF